MNRSQALKAAVRRWGKNAAVRDDGPKRASTPERRAEATKQLVDLRASIPKDRRPTKEEREQIDQLFSASLRMRYTVGVIHTVVFSAFWVKGTGDTWEDAFAEADRRYPIREAA